MAFFAWSNASHYRRAEDFLLENDFQNAYNCLGKVPESYKNKPILKEFARLCLQAETSPAEDYAPILQGLERLQRQAEEPLKSQITAQLDRLRPLHHTSLYLAALSHLHQGGYQAAWTCFSKVKGTYPDLTELRCYTNARRREYQSHTAKHLEDLLASLGAIPTDYNGLFHEEIADYKIQLARRAATLRAYEEEQAGKEAGEEETVSGAGETPGLP